MVHTEVLLLWYSKSNLSEIRFNLTSILFLSLKALVSSIITFLFSPSYIIFFTCSFTFASMLLTCMCICLLQSGMLHTELPYNNMGESCLSNRDIASFTGAFEEYPNICFTTCNARLVLEILSRIAAENFPFLCKITPEIFISLNIF